MPEYPDVTVYIETIADKFVGQRLQHLRIASPFLVRTVVPAPADVEGKRLVGMRRIGKRIIFCFEDELFVAIHLMIAGRFALLKAPGAKIPAKRGLCAFDFEADGLLLTEAGTKRRASMHLFDNVADVDDVDRGGLDIFGASFDSFVERLRTERHTLKRSLTDPRLFDGIGNAYSDEILHHAQLSPVRMSDALSDEEAERLLSSCRDVLTTWTERLRNEADGILPKKVTAFHDDMAVHGKFGQPCPRCDSPVQRIKYASRETNYCAPCQTDGKLLKDRSLSQLLKKDWPKNLDELEALRSKHRGE